MIDDGLKKKIINLFKENQFSKVRELSEKIDHKVRPAKLENIPINQLLDTLSGLEELQVSALVGEIMNNHRPSTSTLGYRQATPDVSKERNVVV